MYTEEKKRDAELREDLCEEERGKGWGGGSRNVRTRRLVGESAAATHDPRVVRRDL